MTAQRDPSSALASVSRSESISGFRSALRRRPSRGPNHIPLAISCGARLMHLPSVHDPNSLLGVLSLLTLLDKSLPSAERSKFDINRYCNNNSKEKVIFTYKLRSLVRKGCY
ncbi:hypothetical protein WN48_10153 [Eufriesea mexicana]|nr:hypothetical protein WN48_10153 [Eufriesea mexicana]